MIDEIRKSANSILKERLSSPFYGTLLISWLVWNWRIVYLTIFIDQDKLSINKIEFIEKNLVDTSYLFTFPIVSTVIVLTIFPFITNGAYWLDVQFTTWRMNQKNKIEGKQLLTIEQSIRLRTEMRELEESIERLMERKNEEIKELKSQLEQVKSPQPSSTPKAAVSKRATRSGKGTTFGRSDYNNLLQNDKLFEPLEGIVKSVRETGKFPANIEDRVKQYYLVNELVEEDGFGGYELTFKGDEVYKVYFNEKFT
jgi:hypothetical protein